MKPKDLQKHYGTYVAAARDLGISKNAVALWKADGNIPGIRQLEIEKKTSGALRADPKIRSRFESLLAADPMPRKSA